MTVSFEHPATETVTLRGLEHSIDLPKLPDAQKSAALSYGIQRMLNDRMKTTADDAEDARRAEGAELVRKFLAGEKFSTRQPGAGRSSDPIKIEMRKIADAEVTANIEALLKHHNVSKSEFNKTFRGQYVAARIEPGSKHEARIRKEAEAAVARHAKAAVSGEVTVAEGGLLEI